MDPGGIEKWSCCGTDRVPLEHCAGTVQLAWDGAQAAPKWKCEAPPHPRQVSPGLPSFGLDTGPMCQQLILLFIHLLPHSILSTFVLNISHSSGCRGDGREQEAKHQGPGSIGWVRCSQKLWCEAGAVGAPAQSSHRLPCSTWVLLSRLYLSQTPPSLFLPHRPQEVHTTKPTSFTTEPDFSVLMSVRWTGPGKGTLGCGAGGRAFLPSP